MSNIKSVEKCYSFLDRHWTESFGDNSDLTDGRYERETDSYATAQANKRLYLLTQANVGAGTRLLDIGCGYGTLINQASKLGAVIKGITISPEQQRYCVEHGYDVVVMPWDEIPTSWFGQYDSLIASGSLEHFVSPEEAIAGQQNKVYRKFFHYCYNLIAGHNGRLVLTFAFFRRKVDPRGLLHPRSKDEKMLNLLYKMYHGFYPNSVEQVIQCAEAYFDFVYQEDGTLDYFKTSKDWYEIAIRNWTSKKTIRLLKWLFQGPFTDEFYLDRLMCLWKGAWIWQWTGEDPPVGLVRLTFSKKSTTTG